MVVLTEIPDDPPPAPTSAPSKPNKRLHTTGEKIKIFRRPYAHHLLNSRVNTYCSECLKEPEVLGKLFTCTACNFVQYCSKECQKIAWKLHKTECARLKTVFPNLPLTDVMFLSKVLDRQSQIELDGDRLGYEADRPLLSLVGHQAEIKADKDKMERFAKIFDKLQNFRSEKLDKECFFDIFCIFAVNTWTLQSAKGDEVALSLDLSVSRYNHSCRPNCTILFEGYYIILRPLTNDVDTNDVKKATISYTDVGRSRYQRRKDLKAKWYFDCKCDRCLDPTDDILTAIRCKNILCDGPVLISEDMEPKAVKCQKCETLADFEYVVRGQQTMLELPMRYAVDSKIADLKGYLERARPILHEKNVYLSRLETAIVQLSGKLGDNVASLYSKVQQSFSACFPTTEARKPFDLVKQAAQLIKASRRKEALPFAFDAMCILEATHGLAHPNYLKTLALWTYLDKHPEKKDDELLALTQLDENVDSKQIDISSLLSEASVAAQ